VILILLSGQTYPLHKPAAKIKEKQLRHLSAYRYCEIYRERAMMLIL